jgi:hypothetical protein
LPLLTRKIEYDSEGRILSDITHNYYTGETYPTPHRKINPSRRDSK